MSTASSEANKRIRTGILIGVIICGVLLFSHISAIMTGAVVILNALAVFEIFQAAHMLSERKLLWTMLLVSVIVSLLPIPEYEKVLSYVFPVSALFFCPHHAAMPSLYSGCAHADLRNQHSGHTAV